MYDPERFTSEEEPGGAGGPVGPHRLSVEENATEETVEELADLLETAGGECVGTVLQSKDSPDPRTFIGEGKVAEVRELVRAMDADMVILTTACPPPSSGCSARN